MFTVGGDRSINLHQMINGRLESRMKWSVANLQAERTVLAIRARQHDIPEHQWRRESVLRQ